MARLTARLNQNPRLSRIADLISEVISLNAKEKRTVAIKKIFFFSRVAT